MVMGTVGYMSPEQVRGEPADARSDIFSFGCVLYEMLAGKRAFEARTGVETMHAILNLTRRSSRASPGKLPPALTTIVRRCLEKRAEQRFQSAADLAFALRSIATGATVTSMQPVAIAAPRATTQAVAPGRGGDCRGNGAVRPWLPRAGPHAPARRSLFSSASLSAKDSSPRRDSCRIAATSSIRRAGKAARRTSTSPCPEVRNRGTWKCRPERA
jgi:serine/threonine protein kinase